MDRSVSNLSTEQLYRKRAFDRVNQRASRARKKSRVSELEDEITDLKKRLAHSEELVRRLQNSEATLREAIDSARSSLQLIDLTAASNDAAIPSPPESIPTATPASEEVMLISHTATSQSGFELDHGTKSTVVPTGFHPTTCFPPLDATRGLALRDENTGLTLGLPLTTDVNDMFPWDYGSPLDRFSTDVLSFSFLEPFTTDLGSNAWASTPTCLPLPLPTLDDPKLIPQWERLPLHVEAATRLDNVLMGILKSSREQARNAGQIAESGQFAEISGPAFPSIRSLLNPEPQNPSSLISNAIGEHGRVTMEIPHLPTKVASMYIMCMFIRWMISPTTRNYDALPEYLRPTELQLTVPHPIWVDILVWPEARDRIIRQFKWDEFPDMKKIANRTGSVNWPYRHSKIFTALSPTELRLSPAFESHIRQYKNWTMGPELAERFPILDCIPTIVQE